MMFLKLFWRKLAQKLNAIFKILALFILAFYRAFLSGSLGSGGACRFYPSCSIYAQLVYKKHSFLKASFFVLKRLLSCHPLGPKVRIEPELEGKDCV